MDFILHLWFLLSFAHTNDIIISVVIEVLRRGKREERGKRNKDGTNYTCQTAFMMV